MYRLLLIQFFGLFVSCLHAQEFGGNPVAIKWKKIQTDTVTVIFPEGLDSAAQRVVTVIHYLAAKNKTLGEKQDKINVVLQNQTTIANGYVGLGPYRSEFMMTPSFSNFDLGSIDWAGALASHEYRHVQQYSNFRVGLSKAMYYLFGEEGLDLAINASIPDWFYEGDAVYNETVHTQQGRGRIPFFLNQYKSLWLADKKYSWMKLRNGSLKDFVPTHYQLGYLLVNYGSEKYGQDFWGKVTHDAASFQGLIYPFQNAIKKHAGIDYKTFRNDAFTFYKKEIPELLQLKEARLPDGQALQANINREYEASEQKISAINKKYVTNYFFPYQLGNDSLLYVKSSYRMRPAFVIKDKQGEHVLRVKDVSLDEHFSYRNGLIVYTAFKPDARWGWKNFGEIKLLDIRTGEQRTVTHKSKYFVPDISADGKKIVAVNYEPNGKCELHILDASSGEILKRISASTIAVFTDPKFIDDNSLVSSVRLSDGRMSLAKITPDSDLIEYLTEPSWFLIGFPNVRGNMVFYTGSYNGNDELYAYDLNNKKSYKLTGSPQGKYFVNAGDASLVYSTFTADGYQLMSKITATEFVEFDLKGLQPANSFKVANENAYENLQISPSVLPTRNFQVSKYNKGTRLLNFHSWRPYYEDPIFTFSLYSENVLNTLQTELYYLYNQNEKTNALGFNTVFGGLFPYLSTGTEYTFKRTDVINNVTRQWNQLDTRIGWNVPLNFSGGRFFRNLNFGSSFYVRNETNTGPTKNLFAENNFNYLAHFISYSQQLQMARQHIYPRFAYSILLQHRHAITNLNGYQYIGSANLYLPGFLSTHSIVLNGSYQQRDTLRALFGNRFAYSRGFNEFYFSRMWKLGANYHFPLLLPDWGFGNILYVQRIRANAFFDFTKVYSRDKTTTRDQRSMGAEFYADTKWWNQYPLTFGFRISKLLNDDLLTGRRGTYFEFILPVSIIPK